MSSNVLTNRFKPLIAFTTPDRSNLPPAPNLPSIAMRHGSLINREVTDVDQLRRLLMKNIHSFNETNFFGESSIARFVRRSIARLFRNVCPM